MYSLYPILSFAIKFAGALSGITLITEIVSSVNSKSVSNGFAAFSFIPTYTSAFWLIPNLISFSMYFWFNLRLT